MPYDIKYVIASHNRITTIKEKTLPLLESYQIPTDDIFIFVAPCQLEAYQKALPNYNVIEGRLGLMSQRNYMTEYFAEGTPLVVLDDDIESLWCLDPADTKKLIRLEDLKAMVDFAFLTTETHGLSLWGVYPIKNAYFMKRDYSIDLKFIMGTFWGIFNRKDITNKLDFKDDYERTLRCYKRDGGVLRLNHICFKSKMYANGGWGLKHKERIDFEKEAVKSIMDMFPGLVRMNKRREGEILLSRTKANGKARTERGTVKEAGRTASSSEGMDGAETK